MSVYKRGKSWAVLVDVGLGRDGKRIRHYEGGFSTKKLATQAEIETRSRLANGSFVDRSALTVEAYLTDWLRLQHSLKPSTLSGYSRNLKNHVIPAIGSLKLQNLTAGDLNRLYADLLDNGRIKVGKDQGGPLSPSTVRQIATVVRKALQDALMSNLVIRNVADGALKPRQSRNAGSTMRTWPAAEVRRFLSETSQDSLHPLWTLLATTGLRRGEALGLHWEDVDLDRAVASIRRTLVVIERRATIGTPKSGAGRVVALAGQSVEALRARRRNQLEERFAWGEAWTETGLVFTQANGTPIHPDSVTDAFRRTVRRLGLPSIRLHDLRHTWATLALESGVPIKIVSENLGHSTIRITADTYSHVTPTMAASAVMKVAGAIFNEHDG